MTRARFASLSAAGFVIAGGVVSLAGCSHHDVAQTSDEVNEAPGMYSNAINRAKDVSGKVERRQSEGLPGPGAADASGNNPDGK